ncbi:MAG TPA: hypothetical protein VJ400_06925 [Thermoplasmata archaeon]|nr:hypothetical protein [Thermoplasmata archaeon]
MHGIARVLAVAYLILAAFAAAVYVQITANYVNVAGVQEGLERGIGVSSVWLNWTGNASDRAIAVVNFSVHNVGNVAVLIVGIDYEFHMDNVYDPRDPYHLDKLEATRIAYISISMTRAEGIEVRAGESRTVSSTVFVVPGTPEGDERMSRFDRPDDLQRYHPYLSRARLFYTFAAFELPYAAVYIAPFYETEGVVPDG